MKSIMTTYPDFQALPKGLKQLLLASESFFFDEMSIGAGKNGARALEIVNSGHWLLGMRAPHPLWRN